MAVWLLQFDFKKNSKSRMGLKKWLSIIGISKSTTYFKTRKSVKKVSKTKLILVVGKFCEELYEIH